MLRTRLHFEPRYINPNSWERLYLKCDGTRAEARFRLSAKRTSPFKSAGASVQSTTDSRGLGISGSNAGYIPCSEVVWRVLATHCIRQFSLHFFSRVSPCAIIFQLDFTIPAFARGWDSSVCIATRYGMYGPGDRIPVGGEIFRTRPERPWGPPSFLYKGYWVLPGDKAAGAWR